jgi:uncharacterized protein (TIGR03083 family)
MRRMAADTADLLRALRASHEQIAPIAARTEAVTGPSYCDDWTVAQVFSHLGSGAEIGYNLLQTTLDGGEAEPNEAIWARWNAMSPAEMAAGYVTAQERYLRAYEALDQEKAASLLLPFFIGPSPVSTVLTFRLHEHVLHAWDILVAGDPHATLLPGALALMLEIPLGMARFAAKPGDADLPGPVRVAVTTTDPDRELAFTTDGDEAALAFGAPTDPTGTLTLPAEAFLRLFSGRLDPDHTPDGVTVTGTPTLEQLRKIFPGY